MLRVATLSLLILVVTGIVAAGHYYLWLRLVRDVSLSKCGRKIGTYTVIGLAVIFPAIMTGSRFIEKSVMRPVYMVGFTLFGISLLLIMCSAVFDSLKLLLWIARRVFKRHTSDEMEAEQRIRVLWARTAAVSTIVASVALCSYGLRTALGPARIQHLDVQLPQLADNLNNTKVVQLSDLHIGPTLKRDWLSNVVLRVNSLQPDMIVITGDLVDGTVEGIGREVAPIQELKARYGVYFVTGNHEYIIQAAPWIHYLRERGIVVLQNESIAIGPKNSGLFVAGVDDWINTESNEQRRHLLDSALRHVDKRSAVILLTHQPRWIQFASEKNVDLQLSGHTHGGQIYPWHHIVKLQQRYLSGKYQVKNTVLYVHRGTGFWGPPLRLGAAPEITVITLKSGRF